MKYIAKHISNEPRSLKEHRSTPGATYNDCNKEDIRLALLKEQGYLCAYCMQRIDETLGKNGMPVTRIEHYEAQKSNAGEDLQMNYLNMLGVCSGDRGLSEDLLHCDKSRRNASLTIDPRQKDCEQHIHYSPNGRIYSNKVDVHNDLDKILNLNTPYLKNGRKAAMNIANKNLKAWKEGDIKQAIKKWEQLNKQGKYQEFCQAAIYYLQKKLRQLS